MRILLLAALVVLFSCEEDREFKNDGCVDESKITNGACPEYHAPVCGCNNITYSNPCFAESAGVLNWTQGACK